MACGAAIVVTYRQRVLFGKRRAKSTGYLWQLPGGWILPGEAALQAAERELREETGLCVRNPRFVAVTSNRFDADIHSMSLIFEAECVDPGALTVTETEKCMGWEWLAWDAPGERLFLPLRRLVESGYRPFSGAIEKTWFSL